MKTRRRVKEKPKLESKKDIIFQPKKSEETLPSSFPNFYCPLGHTLVYNASRSKCNVCGGKKSFFVCEECQFHLCLNEDCFPEFELKEKHCVINHSLKWHPSKTKCNYCKGKRPCNNDMVGCTCKFACVRCGNQEKNGLQCEICSLFFLCIECSGYEFKEKFCLFDHPLIWQSSNLPKCVKCQKASKGLQCAECPSFCLCLDCSGFKINQNSCLFDHTLTWSASPIMCFICEGLSNIEHQSNNSNSEKEGEKGLKCSSCLNFEVCLECLDFKFPLDSCPSDEVLQWTSQERICSKCDEEASGFYCSNCEYMLCLKCKGFSASKQF